jgi:hypothetical protein
MEDDFLANNLLVHIEGEIADKYNYEDIMKEFKDAKRLNCSAFCLLIPLEYVF